ncbi:TetR family transcriptional regulator [Microbacterium sp. NPDC055683]
MAWDTEATKRRILDAATAEFVAHGLHGTTIERIARRASVNKERIYNYFGGKPALFAEVLRSKVEEGVGSVAFTGAAVEEVADFAERLVAFNRSRPDLIRLLAWEALAYTDEVPDESARVEMYRERTEALAAAQDDGALTSAFTPEMLHVLLLSLAGYGALLPHVVRMITGLSPDDEHYRAAVVEAARRLAAP